MVLTARLARLMSSADSKLRAARPFVWVLVLLAWLDLWHRITTSWPGTAKVGWMAVLLVATALALRWRRFLPSPGTSRALNACVLVGFLAAAAWVTSEAVEILNRPERRGDGSDIALNTVAAGDWFLQGKNPYRERSQVQYVMEPGPLVSVTSDEVRLLGVPYAYGYPYFPVMFLTYLPFRWVTSQVNCLRLGNLLMLALNSIFILALARRLVPGRAGWTIGGLSAIAALSVELLIRESFDQGITDVIISTYALIGFWFMSRQQMGLAGVFLGLAQSCKLLPGPLLIAPALIWLFRKPGFWPLLIGYVLTCLLFIGPFFFASPAALKARHPLQMEREGVRSTRRFNKSRNFLSSQFRHMRQVSFE